jgi:predicted amidohydrolase
MHRFRRFLRSTPEEKQNLLSFPIPKNEGMVKFKIEKKHGFFNKLYPTFYILSPEGEFIMNAKKHIFSKTQNFHMSVIKGDFSKKGKGYLGKLKGTQFN